MNVDTLQVHLTNLSQLLRSAGGQKTAGELDEFCQSLDPFRDKKIKDLVASISRAEAVIRNGSVPPRTPRVNGIPKNFASVSARVIDLYDRASQPSVSKEEIISVFDELKSCKPKKPQLKGLAEHMQITEDLTIPKLIEKMKLTVLDRKGAIDRAEA